ncbi:drug/metabolite transporter superfamily [Infundibulicybe gibba]|nr:drug/metabolite transporter superfamily [Infundibulicybe gibba]
MWIACASQAFASLMNAAVKKLHSVDPPISTVQLIVVRMGITYACCLIYMLSAGVPDPFLGPEGVRILLAFRGFTGFFSLLGMYYSLQYLSLSDATVLTFLAPSCTAIAGSLLLNEKFSVREALAGMSSLFGVVLIARPAFIFGVSSQDRASAGDIVSVAVERSTSSQRLVAVGVALVGVLGSTGSHISIRAIGKRAHPLHLLTSLSIQCVLVSTTYMIVTTSPFVIPARILGFFAQVLLTMGLQRETAGRGTLALYTQVIFATILERIFFKSVPSVLSVCGALIILTAALYVVLTKKTNSNDIVHKRPEEQALEEGTLENFEPGESILEDERLMPCDSIELRSIRA